MKRLSRALIASVAVVVATGGCTSSSPKPSGAGATVVTTTNSTAATKAAAGTTAPGGPAVTTKSAMSASKISWKKCDDPDLPPGLECGSIKLPTDPKKPEGETFDMALSRLPATGKATGSIIVNPGGPGGSGLAYAMSVSRSMSEPVLAKYDIIGFDPRGVGKSMPIDCVDDAWLDRYALTDPTPDNAEEKAIDKAADMDVACAAQYPDESVFSTINVTADMDALRIALGHDKLDYYGASYGSYLGGVYATLYPTKVGHFVLDAAFVPEKDGATATLVQQKGFNKAFGNWVTYCNTDKKCPFHADDTLARWNKLVDQLEAKPLMVGQREVGEGAISSATYASMYSRSEWAVLARALTKAENGDGSGLLSIFDNFYGRSPDGKWENLPEANTVIGCASGISQSIDTGVDELVKELKAAGPLGRFVTNDGFASPCKVKAVFPDYKGDQTIVVVGSQNDPATPYSQSLVLTKAMGPKARLITFTGEGHGGVAASQCSSDAVSAYFDAGTPPKDGLTCGPREKATSPLLEALVLPPSFADTGFEDAAEALGLDSATFATKTFSATNGLAKITIAELQAAVLKQGFTLSSSEPIDAFPDTYNAVFTNKSDDRVIAIVFGSKALETKDLQGLAALVEKGQSLVIVTTPKK
jgi:pimeloyl-ACP methyl ester carboxylesterase